MRMISNALNYVLNKPRFLRFNKRNKTTYNEKSILTLKDMPQYNSFPLLGKLQFITAGGATMIHKYVDKRHKKLGPIFTDKLSGKTNLVFVSDPAFFRSVFIQLEGKYPLHILPEAWMLYEKLYGPKRGLFFMDGEEWLSNRRIMNKHFLRDDSEKWLQAPIKRTVEKFIGSWKIKSGDNGFYPDLESEFYRLSIDVIVSVLLGNSKVKLSSKYEHLLSLFSDSVKKIFITTTKLYNLPVNWCYRWNLRAWRDFKDSVDTSLYLGHKMVTEILKANDNHDGLLQKLCDDKVDDEIIRRIVVDFVIAAGDTTAYTTLWTLYLLAKNKNEQNELRKNQDSYVKNVVKESMRLYPVAPFLTRILPKECLLGPYQLQKGTPIIASIYTSGRDEMYFSKADQFLPYRWDRGDPRKADLINHEASASLPFALGARSCIGKKMAQIQLAEVIKQVIKNFELKCTNIDDIQSKSSQILVPNKQIKMLVCKTNHLI